MTQEIKDEALEQIEMDVKFGFETEEELFDGILDMFYTEEDFDKDWLKQVISEKYQQHQKDSVNWSTPTDFQRLAQSFDELIKQKIVCLHKAGYTKQDGIGDCEETIEELKKIGIKAMGFCYYHIQDLMRAINPEIRNLYLGFDSATQNDNEALQVAHKIIEVLKKNGFEINWPETVDERIEIKNINWQKVPDNENRGMQRVIQIMSDSNNKKPFWKFW